MSTQLELIKDVDLCSTCDRTVDDCDDDPSTSVDRWNYKTESHYTVDSECPGYTERHDEPDFEEPDPDYDIDEEACWGGVEWP